MGALVQAGREKRNFIRRKNGMSKSAVEIVNLGEQAIWE
jgi:hypothetical protein